MKRRCKDCMEGYRCPKHLPKVEPCLPELCLHKWWRFVGVLLKCMACGAGGEVL
jgi:hypothetical protein